MTADTERFVIRPAAAADLGGVQAVVTRAGLRSGRDLRALDFYRTSPGGRLIVGVQHERVIGVAYSVSFGRTGWLGNVGVDPDARGQGLGSAMSEAAVGWLHQAGVTTVLLTATKLGRPVYERLGFTDEGVPYSIWQHDPALPLADVAVATATATDMATADPGDLAEAGPEHMAVAGPGRIADVVRQDAAATGEDRSACLSLFAAGVRVVNGPGGAGHRVALPWGGGPIAASSADAARGLLLDLIRTEAGASLAFPERNVAGAKLAAALGFRQIGRCVRMRLGPPVPGFRPERIFNVFSMAIG